MKHQLLSLLRLPSRVWRLVWQRWLPLLSYLASYLRSPWQALSVWPERGIPLGPRVALFVHFDRGGAVRPYTLQYLSALRDSGLSVVLVSNSGQLRPDAMAVLRGLCAAVIVRRNVGYDFGAMREGLELLGLPRPDTEMVVLVNDSVYGPLQPLEPVLRQIDFSRSDMWGLTESWQIHYHVQSYFLAFGPTALTSPAWQAFWRRVRPVSSKWWVILHYEIGLTQHFLRAGLRVQAVWHYQDLVRKALAVPMPTGQDEASKVSDPEMLDPLAKDRLAQALRIRTAVAARMPLNPTSDFWRQLIELGFPFFKRELLVLNPTQVRDLSDWRETLRNVSAADLDAVECDFQRVMRNRAP